jgi:hypothetical protein
VNTVHDSIISEVAPGEEEVWADAARVAYTSDVYRYIDTVYNYKFSIPLGVTYNLGKYWGDGDELLYELNPEEVYSM